ncbi:hypothetical protein Gotri_002012 [Gossypium trilobum]|uniref:Uncharacterized protein n=1 Tax=Gossypium trilobum TaxID=34281 RepID=A0A7J9F6Y2_9ROSI|nr:hypothetical protein [Gossypium trilobum]
MCKAIEYFAISAPTKSFPILSIVGVRWHPPPQGWFKLNTNGFALSNPGNILISEILLLNLMLLFSLLTSRMTLSLTPYYFHLFMSAGPLSPNLNAISFNTHSGKATAVRTCWPNLEALFLFVPLTVFCLACIHFVNNLHTV